MVIDQPPKTSDFEAPPNLGIRSAEDLDHGVVQSMLLRVARFSYASVQAESEADSDVSMRERMVAKTYASLDWASDAFGQISLVYANAAGEQQKRNPHVTSGRAVKLQEVADSAHMARMELSCLRSGIDLAGGARSGHWNIIAKCAEARTKIQHLAMVLEGQVCMLGGMPTALHSLAQTGEALLVRGMYVNFRHGLLALGQPEPAAVEQHLRRASVLMARMSGNNNFTVLRIADKVMFVRMRERMIEWFSSAGKDPREGLRIWQDLLGMSELFMQINNRAELAAHDTRVVWELMQLFTRGAWQAPRLPDAQWREAVSLLGLDREADDLIRREEKSTAHWMHVIERKAGDLGLSGSRPREEEITELMDDFFADL
ncbi:MAG: hypothetical protein GMKNLPBB_03252 [Myxococcota bacterium]|nr:hypothetical protein [Myxococcota bacterium]